MNRDMLIQAGVDYDEGVRRFGGQPVIYEKYLIKFFKGHLMDELEQQVDHKDIKEAFKTAHALKGTAGNLSLRAYYESISVLTDILRKDDLCADYTPALERTRKLYDVARQAAVGGII